ncbi:MAG: VacJ family lipoprotein [Methylococcaceae bacterium]|nr:VacJ family lipoprotein [Methylococcaceae bacterium]
MLSLLFKKDRSKLFFVSVFLILFFLSGCASHHSIDSEPSVVEVNEQEIDPFEGVNRKVYSFNKVVDEYVAKPISDAYIWVTPKIVQTGVSNFFNNLSDINVFLNDFMQGKLRQGGLDTGRFLVNSTLGLGGLFDVATGFGLQQNEEDFAQTLAVWGVPQGPYLMIPVLGPMTSRGIPGAVFDAAANPTSYIGFGVPLQFLQMLQVINARANAEGDLKFINEAALDPYIFTREAFLQYRKNLIADGELSGNEDDFFDLEDDFYEEDQNESINLDIDNKPVVSKEVKVNSAPTLPVISPQVEEVDIDEQIRQVRLRLKLRSTRVENTVFE